MELWTIGSPSNTGDAIDYGRIRFGVHHGVLVTTFKLKAGIEIPAVVIGESGRGRSLGVLPVQLLPNEQIEWEALKEVEIKFGRLGQTRNGAPKLFQTEKATSNDVFLGVFYTPIGFRGSNEHGGDLVTLAQKFPMHAGSKNADRLVNDHFPGEIVLTGKIAQGDAGRAGSGEHIIAVVPKGKVFYTGYNGRMYGKPDGHYYVHNGATILMATWQERQVSDLF